MSRSFTPANDIFNASRLPSVEMLFTTFAKGHFVKPGKFTQPARVNQKVEASEVERVQPGQQLQETGFGGVSHSSRWAA